MKYDAIFMFHLTTHIIIKPDINSYIIKFIIFLTITKTNFFNKFHYSRKNNIKSLFKICIKSHLTTFIKKRLNYIQTFKNFIIIFYFWQSF